MQARRYESMVNTPFPFIVTSISKEYPHMRYLGKDGELKIGDVVYLCKPKRLVGGLSGTPRWRTSDGRFIAFKFDNAKEWVKAEPSNLAKVLFDE